MVAATGPLIARLPLVTLAVCLTALALLAAPAAVTDCLQFHRPRIADGELWRLVTGHTVHYSAAQGLRDVLAFGILGWSLENDSRPALLRTLAAALITVPFVLWTVEGDLLLYRGLSALDYALLGALCARAVREGQKARLIGLSAFAAAVAWIGWQWVGMGATVDAAPDADAFTPVPSAHLAGLLAGFVPGLLVAEPASRNRTIE